MVFYEHTCLDHFPGPYLINWVQGMHKSNILNLFALLSDKQADSLPWCTLCFCMFKHSVGCLFALFQTEFHASAGQYIGTTITAQCALSVSSSTRPTRSVCSHEYILSIKMNVTAVDDDLAGRYIHSRCWPGHFQLQLIGACLSEWWECLAPRRRRPSPSRGSCHQSNPWC